MSSRQNEPGRQIEATTSASPVAWLVFKQEFIELWSGRRVFNLLILFSVLLSLTSFLLATNNEVRLLARSQTLVVALTAAITLGLFIGLIIAAESISGERERGTLEAVLLTPASRQQIVLGKFLVALTPWPVILLLAIPYITVLAQGDAILGPALLWGAILGSLLAVIFICLGMLLSIWSNSTRVSLAVGLLIYVLALIPAQLPTEFQATAAGAFVAAIDPLEASRQFLDKTLVAGQSLSEVWIYLALPVLFAVLLLGVLILYAAPRLSLEVGRSIRWRIWRPVETVK